jgi:hypothetical protein
VTYDRLDDHLRSQQEEPGWAARVLTERLAAMTTDPVASRA